MLTSANRIVGLAAGFAYLLFGMLGFLVSAGHGFADARGGLLFGVFEVNGFANVVHIVIGAALALGAVSSTAAASLVNQVVGALFLVLGLAGLFMVETDVNPLALNVSDNVLHFGTASVLLAVGLGADQRGSAKVRDDAAEPSP